MWRSIEESFDHDKTLFILDGLDEVSHKWCSGAAMDDFLNHLLRQPKVIITTRPHTLNRNDLEPLDLELETIGFRPEQVTAYVNNTEKESAEQIHTFIRSHQLIQGLVRIPIQLDALCYGWKHDSFLQNELQTMTMLYQAIELNLWKKDICRLEKKSANGELLTEKQVRNLGTNKIKRLVQHELKFLECLAFSGLYNNFTDFNSNYRDLVEDILLSTEREVPDDILGKVSFLRTSDSSFIMVCKTCSGNSISEHNLISPCSSYSKSAHFFDWSSIRARKSCIFGDRTMIGTSLKQCIKSR
jgi:hypothetical protein